MGVLISPLRFNTQPPEGGWRLCGLRDTVIFVSTHSRLKAAGFTGFWGKFSGEVSTHSRLKAAGVYLCMR